MSDELMEQVDAALDDLLAAFRDGDGDGDDERDARGAEVVRLPRSPRPLAA